jgi:hypothetical protein
MLGNLLYISLLLLNAIAILNEERFLARGACVWLCVAPAVLRAHLWLTPAPSPTIASQQSDGHRRPPLTSRASRAAAAT